MRRVCWLAVLCLVLAACSGKPATDRAGVPIRSPASVTPLSVGPSSVGPSSVGPSSVGPSATPRPGSTPSTLGVPRWDHVVIVVFENHGYDRVVGATQAPYLNAVASAGLLLTDAHGVTHPSQPNYLALFAGSTYGVTDDSCPRDLAGTGNLGSQLLAAGRTFGGYSEGMPGDGYRGCSGGHGYARKHNPWVDFTVLPAGVNRTFAAFPADLTALSTVSFVVPNLCDDMHDCPVSTGDGWAAAHLAGYLAWATTHNSVLIVTWDEDEDTGGGTATGGHIPTIVAGAHVVPGRYAGPVDHYRVLRTVEAAYGLPGLGVAAGRTPIDGVWR